MKLQFDNELHSLLESFSGRSILCSILVNCSSSHFNPDINWVKISDNDMISYLPLSKHKKDTNPFESRARMHVKYGRFINKILTKASIKEFSIKDSDIEFFSNILKSQSAKYDGTYFETLSGLDINKYYSSEFYHINEFGDGNGTMWNSCMTYPKQYNYFDIYADNAKLLVLFSKEKRVIARALLWEATSPDKKEQYKIMDRIYFYNESDIELFKQWANTNGYVYKAIQDAYSPNLFIKDNRAIDLELQIKLVKTDYLYYPYLDTFRFFCRKLKYLRNFDRLGSTCTLIQTNGLSEPSSDDEIGYEEPYEEYDDSDEYEEEAHNDYFN